MKKYMNTLLKKLKNIIVTGILSVILTVCSCNGTEDATENLEIVVASVSATPGNVTLAAGEIRAVKAVIAPDGANQAVYWKSANPDIATVANGIITGIAEGETVITVNSIADASKRDGVTVKVVAAAVPVESVSLEVESTSIYIDDELPLTVIIEPDNATNREILWQNSNPEAAVIIEGEGGRVIKGLARGKTRITVLAGTNTNLTSSVEITVTDRRVPVESISVSQTGIAMATGTTKTVRTSLVPDDATVKTLLWESDNSAVATVSDGVIAAHSPGTAVVTAKSESNPEITASITVSVPDLSSLPSLFAEASGLWLFENPSDIAKASIGNRLEAVGNPIVAVNGIAAASVPEGGYFLCRHGLDASGGGTKVNEYTVLIDFMLPNVNGYCFYQTNLANNDDVDFFLRSNMYQIGIGNVYSNVSADPFRDNVWYRLVIPAKLGESLKYYRNGVEIYSNTSGGGDAALDSRLAFDTEGVLLFADEDGEDSEIFVAATAIWNRALNAEEVAALGTAAIP
jgi:uncharacterized protein YjdB